MIPYRIELDGGFTAPVSTDRIISQGGNYYFDDDVTYELNCLIQLTLTTILAMKVTTMRLKTLSMSLKKVSVRLNAELIYTDSPRLIEIRDALRGTRDLPGTLEEIQDYVYPTD